MLRTTPPAKGGGHSGVAISSLITVCVGAGRRWAFWGDHPGGVAATPPQRGTLAAMGRESVLVHWVVIVSPPPRQRRWAFGCGHLVANHCLCGARAAVGIPGRPPRRCSRHPSAEGNFGCDGAGGEITNFPKSCPGVRRGRVCRRIQI